MNSKDILARERDSPQWLEALSALQGRQLVEPVTDDPFWRIYGPLVEGAAQKQPLVIGQIGQSLDGRIATVGGQSHYINGPAAILHLHRLRALVDAVVIGVGTAVADDPQLTVRHVPGPQPARVVIDPSSRLPANAKCLHADGARRIVITTAEHALAPGVETIRIAREAGGMPPAAIVAALQERGLKRILIEGGGQTVSRFLNAGGLNRLHVMVAPMIIGSGPVGLQLAEITDLKNALRPAVAVHALPGGDMLYDCVM